MPMHGDFCLGPRERKSEVMTFGLILLLLADLWAVLRCWGSTLSLTAKFLWTLMIFFFPLGGLILYILFGRARPASARP